MDNVYELIIFFTIEYLKNYLAQKGPQNAYCQFISQCVFADFFCGISIILQALGKNIQMGMFT